MVVQKELARLFPHSWNRDSQILSLIALAEYGDDASKHSLPELNQI